MLKLNLFTGQKKFLLSSQPSIKTVQLLKNILAIEAVAAHQPLICSSEKMGCISPVNPAQGTVILLSQPGRSRNLPVKPHRPAHPFRFRRGAVKTLQSLFKPGRISIGIVINITDIHTLCLLPAGIARLGETKDRLMDIAKIGLFSKAVTDCLGGISGTVIDHQNLITVRLQGLLQQALDTPFKIDLPVMGADYPCYFWWFNHIHSFFAGIIPFLMMERKSIIERFPFRLSCCAWLPLW